jgi:electron transfer flavoprotein alpha/beta subunit
VLYRCLAKGANVAVRVDGDETDPNIVSFKLFRAIKKLNYDLILTGVESSDGMSSQAGISLASHLDLPFAYAVTRIESVTDATVVVDRELGGGRQQTLEICKPAVLALQSGTGSLTYPPAVKLVQARRSPIPCWTTADLGITDAELAALRKVRFMAIQPRGSSAAIEWLTGTPEKIADEIVCRIRKAL